MMRHLLLLMIMLLWISSCGWKQNTETKIKQEKKREFQLPEVPTMLNTPELRTAYLCEHYWDRFDFADTAYIHLPDITEQSIVNFMYLMSQVPKDLASKSIGILFQKAESYPAMSWYFWQTMSRYWKDANSPMRNEELFILLCTCVESAMGVKDVMKQRASFARHLAEKNRLGQPAVDFLYTLESGRQGRMYDLKAEYTLLFFYDPDCHTCMEVKNQMKNSQRLKELVDNNRMKVLTVYPDEDVALWRERLGDLSASWVNGYDKGQVITLKMLYDLSSIPSFYLLDKNKRVLLKDADWREVMYFFYNKVF